MIMHFNMFPKKDFKPVHDERYVMFIVDDMYGSIEFREYRCEVHYHMIDAEDNAPLPCSAVYNNQDELPFDTPLLFNKKLDKYEVLTDEQRTSRIIHKNPEQRFWMEKSWFLTGNRSMDQIQPHEFDTLSLGIALKADFVKAVQEANAIRLEAKDESNRI